MFKNLKNRAFLRALLQIFIVIIIYIFLGFAIPIVIFSLPLAINDYLNHKQIDLAVKYRYPAFVFLTIFLTLLMIRRQGAENVWKILIGYNVYYAGKSGKYYKYFFSFIISLIIIALLTLFLQAFFK